MNKAKINSNAFSGPFMSQFNGQAVTVTGTKGVSGETTAVLLTTGGQIYLRDDQMTKE